MNNVKTGIPPGCTYEDISSCEQMEVDIYDVVLMGNFSQPGRMTIARLWRWIQKDWEFSISND